MILVDRSVPSGLIDCLRGVKGLAFASVDGLTGARSAEAAITEPIAMDADFEAIAAVTRLRTVDLRE